MYKKQRGGAAKIPVALSALAAIGVILGKFLAINVTDFMRFSLENITIIFAGVVFGPILGLAVGAIQDLVGCIAVGYAINPIITLGSASIGAVSGGVFILLKRAPRSVRISIAVASAHLIGSVLIKSVGLSIFYAMPFGVTVAWRTLNYVIVGVAEAVLLCFLLKSKQLLTQINKITNFSANYKFRSEKEASDYARSVSGVFSKPGLERVIALTEALGSPQRSLKAVHVTGTNGKGSVSSMLTSILSSSGLKVGSFTSPYLFKMNESIRINGEPIAEDELISVFDRLRPIADAAEDKPTEFELLSAAAFLVFHEKRVDVAIIECGMGAKHDATNLIDEPLLSIITGISLDHTSFLGSTVREIAEEKAGIIKRGCPLLLPDVDGEAWRIIEQRAIELSAPILRPCEYEVKRLALDGTVMDCENLKDLRLPLLGLYQPKNASVAIAAANILKSHFPTLTEKAVREGLSRAVWPGRFELLSHEPLLIFDGAHNLEGIESAVESIKAYFDKKVICLTGVLKDKEYEKMANKIATVACAAVTVTPNSPRALSAEDYADVLSAYIPHVHPAKSVSEGVAEALRIAKERELPVICLGSLYLYKEVQDAELN